MIQLIKDNVIHGTKHVLCRAGVPDVCLHRAPFIFLAGRRPLSSSLGQHANTAHLKPLSGFHEGCSDAQKEDSVFLVSLALSEGLSAR